MDFKVPFFLKKNSADEVKSQMNIKMSAGVIVNGDFVKNH